MLTSDAPHHDFLASHLAASLDVRVRLVEPGAAQQRRLWRPGKRVDWLARYWHVRREQLTGPRRHRRAYFAPLTDAARVASIPTLVVSSVNEQDALCAIDRARPDVTVVCGTMYIEPPVLEHTGLTLNIHGGYLPDYRGNHAIFFACYRRDYGKIAATIHLVTPHLDAGEIVNVVYPDVYPHDTDEHLYCRSVHAAAERLSDLLLGFERGAPLACRTQPHEGVLYRHRSRTPVRELALWARRRALRETLPHVPARLSLPVHDDRKQAQVAVALPRAATAAPP